MHEHYHHIVWLGTRMTLLGLVLKHIFLRLAEHLKIDYLRQSFKWIAQFREIFLRILCVKQGD